MNALNLVTLILAILGATAFVLGTLELLYRLHTRFGFKARHLAGMILLLIALTLTAIAIF